MNKLLFFMMAIAFVGFVDATYLTVQHFQGGVLPCTIASGCDVVTTSKYSMIFGYPVAMFGVIGYVSILLMIMLWFDVRKRQILWIVSGLCLFAFLASAYFVYLQVGVLKAICEYCMLSAITSTLLFLCGLFLMRCLRKM